MAQEDLTTDEVYVALFRIDHASLAAPIRLSTDPTERVAEEPVIYGTRSAWAGANPLLEPYLWAIADAILPSDLEDAPATAQIAIEALDHAIIETVRSITSPPTIRMAVVLASTPDVVEAEWSNLLITTVDADAGEIILTISREEIENEFFPAGRMSRDRFPGLHL
ncbi:hypothetical protein [Paracoccus sp. ME4]|uniref:hypothetical protein n=1 Tax=Paracoccus sp. ME4 TaxID=3138066 RepID=UPI00398AD28B